MSATLTVRDETPAGGVSREWSLEFLDETITVRDLIRERVYQEVQDYNRRADAEVFHQRQDVLEREVLDHWLSRSSRSA